MFSNNLFYFAGTLFGMLSSACASPCECSGDSPTTIRVENFLNQGTGFNLVSSLIIGSESAVLVDVPIGIPHTEALVDWIRNTTDKPLVAVFTTHHHPDHNLGTRVILDNFETATFFASENATKHLIEETPEMVCGGTPGLARPIDAVRILELTDLLIWKFKQSERMRMRFGRENITDNPALPTVYPNTFFTLKGHEGEPIHLINNLVGDTVDTTMIWIPSQGILMAGDTVYHHDLHLWLADMDTEALSDSWLKTLDFITALEPTKVITGHAGSLEFDSTVDIEHSRQYIQFFKDEIFSRGANFFSPQEITELFTTAFPEQMNGPGGWASGMFLNNTAGKFGRDSDRLPDILDMKQFNDASHLQNWSL